MKTLVSLALGVAMLFGAATLGLQSGSASAHARNDRNYWHHHRHHHKHHRHHHRNKLSY
jgi:Spy/CpxP family protein refolding chaperone